MRYPPPTSAMALGVGESTGPDYPRVKSPTRTSFVIRHGIQIILLACLTLCLAVSFFIYIVLITFTILPLTFISRRWSNLYHWYTAPIEVQRHIFDYYRDNSKRLASEWDIEKARPIPLARLPRGFDSQELLTSSLPGPSGITRLPIELRLQIYREVILGNSTHVHITVHRARKPGKRRLMSRMHGQFCMFDVRQNPVNDCNCFIISSYGYGRALPRCQAPFSEHAGRGILALSRTCKQIYGETIPLLYSQSYFVLSSSLLHLYQLTESLPLHRPSNILLQLPRQTPLLPPKFTAQAPGPDKTGPDLLPSKLDVQNLLPFQPALLQTAAPAQPPTVQLLQPSPLARHHPTHHDGPRKR